MGKLAVFFEIYKAVIMTTIALLLAGSWFHQPLKVQVVGGYMDVDVGNTVSVDVGNTVDANVVNTVDVEGTVSIRR